jgi:hypothetical protein
MQKRLSSIVRRVISMNRQTPVDEYHPANSEVLSYLRSHALERPKWALDKVAVPYETHARDDLEEHLYELGGSLPEYSEGLSYGFPILVHPKGGIIFALATDTNTTAIRLPKDARRDALASGAVELMHYKTVGLPESSLSARDIGSDWVLVNAYGPVEEGLRQQWVQKAYDYAEELAA